MGLCEDDLKETMAKNRDYWKKWEYRALHKYKAGQNINLEEHWVVTAK